eukprot:6198236-Pleurochrysis_carterae.AAC.2
MTGTSTVVLQQSDDGRESSQQGQPDSVIKLKTGPSEIDPKGASSQPPSASAAAAAAAAVVSVYEEVPFADLEFVEDDGMYYYECPCGDMFELSVVRCHAVPLASISHRLFLALCAPYSALSARQTRFYECDQPGGLK